MAIAVTALDTQKGSGSSITSDSVSVTNGDYLLVAVGGGKDGALSNEVTAVAVNGNALTKLVESIPVPNFDGRDRCHVSIWGLKVTSSITGTIAATCGGGSNNTTLWLSAIKATGFDTATPIGDTDSIVRGNGSGDPRTLTLTTVSGDVVFGALAFDCSFNQTVTGDGAQTELYNAGVAADEVGLATAYKAASGTSTTVSWTASIDWTFRLVAVVLSQAAGGGGSGIARIVGGKILGGNIINGGLVG